MGNRVPALDGLRGIAVLLVVAWLACCQPCARVHVSVLGDSIAHGCCTRAVAGPAPLLHELGPVTMFAVGGNTIRRVTPLVSVLPPGAAWVHVGVNDVRSDNAGAGNDLSALVAALTSRHDLAVVIDEIGPLPPAERTEAREAMRARLNEQIRAVRAVNVVSVPFVATSLPDGLHPDDAGYAQQMPLVLDALRSLTALGSVR